MATSQFFLLQSSQTKSKRLARVVTYRDDVTFARDLVPLEERRPCLLFSGGGGRQKLSFKVRWGGGA